LCCLFAQSSGFGRFECRLLSRPNSFRHLRGRSVASLCGLKFGEPSIPFRDLRTGIRRLQFGYLTLALPFSLLGPYSIVLGFALRNERMILDGNFVMGHCLNPTAGNLELPAGQWAAFICIECLAGASEPLAPDQELLAFLEPSAQWGLTQQRFMRYLEGCAAVAA
jgi:hypothetical protein